VHGVIDIGDHAKFRIGVAAGDTPAARQLHALDRGLVGFVVLSDRRQITFSEHDPIRPSCASGLGFPSASAGIFFMRNRSRPSGKSRKAFNAVLQIARAVARSVGSAGAGIGGSRSAFAMSRRSSRSIRRALPGVIKTSGGLFNFLSGSRARAPQWMQDVGLEWAWRIWLEPRRLFWRYLTTNPRAMYLLFNRSCASDSDRNRD